MLEGLDAIGWHDLEHAYGPADDVPGLLRDLASADEEARQHAHYELYGNIYPQGTVYSATAYAVPFLLELVENEAISDRGWILGYLASLAHGTSFIEVHQHSRMFPDLAAEQRTPEVEALHQQELAHVRRIRTAVREGIPLYLRLLNHADAEVREGAAAVSGTLP